MSGISPAAPGTKSDERTGEAPRGRLSRKGRAIASRLALSGGALVIALAAAETGLRLFYPFPSKPYILPPDIVRVFHPAPGVMPGVEGTARYTTNADGLRGEPVPEGEAFRIIAVGGSTTQCLYLDDRESWPRILQDRLRESGRFGAVWVGDAGMSGRRMKFNVLHVDHLLETHPDLDMLILLVGCNDLLHRLEADEAYDPRPDTSPKARWKTYRRAFSVWPYDAMPDRPLYRRTAIDALVENLKERRKGRSFIQDEEGHFYAERRRWRREAGEVREGLPGLSSALAEYKRHIESVIRMARAKGVRLLFLTQPALWRSDLPAELQNLLWAGKVGSYNGEGGSVYYGAAALAEGLSRFNGLLLETCRAHGVPCLDLARFLPQDTFVFYDDVHFNEAGCRRVADEVARFILNEVRRL